MVRRPVFRGGPSHPESGSLRVLTTIQAIRKKQSLSIRTKAGSGTHSPRRHRPHRPIGLCRRAFRNHSWLGRKLNARRGLLLGSGGLPLSECCPGDRPPGRPASSKPICGRQLWWLATVVLTAGGALVTRCHSRPRWFHKLAGIAVIPAAPHGGGRHPNRPNLFHRG